MQKELNICVNCGFLNTLGQQKCQQCGTDLLTESADPIQTAKAEGHFLGNLAKGGYERQAWKIVLAIFIGLTMSVPVVIVYWIVIANYFSYDRSDLDIPVLIFLTPFLVLLTIGLKILFHAIKKIFAK